MVFENLVLQFYFSTQVYSGSYNKFQVNCIFLDENGPNQSSKQYSNNINIHLYNLFSLNRSLYLHLAAIVILFNINQYLKNGLWNNFQNYMKGVLFQVGCCCH